MSQAYGFYQASPGLYVHRDEPVGWAQLEPTSLGIEIRALTPTPQAPPAEAGHWTVGYPTIEVRTGTRSRPVLETRINPAAILSAEFREQLQATLEQASRLVRNLGAAIPAGAAVSHV